MAKYVFRPNLAVVKEDWVANTQATFPTTDEELLKVRLIVDVEGDEQAQQVRMPITNILAWEQVEDEA